MEQQWKKLKMLVTFQLRIQQIESRINKIQTFRQEQVILTIGHLNNIKTQHFYSV